MEISSNSHSYDREGFDTVKADGAVISTVEAVISRLGPVELRVLEDVAIKSAIRAADGNRTLAARSLGISVRTLQRKIKHWSLDAVNGNGVHNNNFPRTMTREEREWELTELTVTFGGSYKLGDFTPCWSNAPAKRRGLKARLSRK